MQILLVIDGMHPRDGGPPRVVAGSALALVERGHRVAIVTSVLPGEEELVRSTWAALVDGNVELHFCAPMTMAGLFLPIGPPPNVRALIDRVDVVHLHGLWSSLLLAVARYALQKGRPYLISIHGVLDRRAMWRTRFKWFKKRCVVALGGVRRLLRNASGVIFGSEAEAGESWDIAPGMNAMFIPNGVRKDIARSAPAPEARKTLHDVVPAFPSWRRSLLFFSRIHPEKGLDMLVSAFNAVAPDFRDTGLLIAGLRQDDVYLAHVERLIEEGGSPGQIALTTELIGARSHFLHSMCDVFVLPSQAEGFSVALVEAFAHGMPCLVTRYCHAPLVESERAGVVVEPTVAGIEAGLRTLLSLDQAALSRMGDNARTLFETRYTWDRVAGQLEDAYCSGMPASTVVDD